MFVALFVVRVPPNILVNTSDLCKVALHFISAELGVRGTPRSLVAEIYFVQSYLVGP